MYNPLHKFIEPQPNKIGLYEIETDRFILQEFGRSLFESVYPFGLCNIVQEQTPGAACL